MSSNGRLEKLMLIIAIHGNPVYVKYLVYFLVPQLNQDFFYQLISAIYRI